MAYKTVTLDNSNDLTVSKCMFSTGLNKGAIYPQFQGGMSSSSYNYRNTSGEYDGGDRVIGFPNSYEVDGDLLMTVGWGDGFAIRRLNNDGTLSKIYHQTSFLYRDATSTYGNMISIAIDTTNKLGVVMTYNVDGYTTFDYSGCTNGGTTFVKDARPTHSNPDTFIGGSDTSNGYIRRVGHAYVSGLVAAGEWIYAGEHNARHYKKVMRRNLNTGVEEILDNTDKKSGSADIDRNGYRYILFYDEVNDRVFYFSYYNGNFIMVLDASTSSPELVWCDIGDAGKGDDAYEQGLFIKDPVNSPNTICIGGSSRILELDITPCLTGSAPTVNKEISVTSFTSNIYSFNQFRFGNKYQKTSGTPMDKQPGYPGLCEISADRGYFKMGGWVDWDNEKTVGPIRADIVEETSGRGGSFSCDYGNPAVLMSSANGTKYWVKMGYGGHGHGFTVWDESAHPFRLRGTWELTHGTFTLDNSSSVDYVAISNLDNFEVPTNCSLNVFVSNNNGSTWETYDPNSSNAHTFTSVGTQLKVKIQGQGHPDKAPYYLGAEGLIHVVYGSLHAAQKNTNIKFKVTRKRLRS